MKKNKHIAFEVVGLMDVGYMLADNQADLTLIQKLFLIKAIPLVRKEQEKVNSNNNDTRGLKERIRAKRRRGGIS